jgi:hypothetical protein
MRNLVLCVALLGCNDDNLMNTNDLSMSVDLLKGPDMTMLVPNGVSCGNQTCAVGSVCCVTPGSGSANFMCKSSGSCGDGGATLACDGPEDCSSSSPDCCATAKFMLGQGDMGGVTPQGADAMCTADAACPASVDLTAGELHTKLCHTAGDCVGYSGMLPLVGAADFNGCCTSAQAPGIQFCAPTQFMKLMGMTLYNCQ